MQSETLLDLLSERVSHVGAEQTFMSFPAPTVRPAWTPACVLMLNDRRLWDCEGLWFRMCASEKEQENEILVLARDQNFNRKTRAEFWFKQIWLLRTKIMEL